MHTWRRGPALHARASRTLIPLALACLSLAVGPPRVYPRGQPTPQHTRPAAGDGVRWFPRQVAPRALVRTIPEEQFPEPRLATG